MSSWINQGIQSIHVIILSLFQYIKEEMPYQDPSLLTDQQRWDVVAFLLRENGIRPEPSFRRRMPR